MEKRAELKHIALVFVILIISLNVILAVPDGPSSIRSVQNRTKAVVQPVVKNDTGGYIYVINITSRAQNSKWKAYVGNVSGTLTLDDASSYTIYDWNLANTLTGEIYATRKATTVDWAKVACANITHIERENVRLSHTNARDNISATFDGTDNTAFTAGNRSMTANSCRTTNIYVNDTAPLNDDFEEVVLYDGTNTTNGRIVFASLVETDRFGYNTGAKYDFQMLLPSNGSTLFTGRIGYYFYVELQ